MSGCRTQIPFRYGGVLWDRGRGKLPGLHLERQLWDAGTEVVAGVDEAGRGSWAGPLTVAAVVAEPGRRIYKVRDSKMLRPDEREMLHDRIVGWASALCVAHATVEECMALGMSAAQRLAARRAVGGLGLLVDHVLVDGPWDFVTAKPIGGKPAGGHRSADSPGARMPGVGAGSHGKRAQPTPPDSETPNPRSAAPAAPAAATVVRGDSESLDYLAAHGGGGPAGVTTVVRGDSESLSIAAASVIAKVTRDRMMAAATNVYPAYWFASNKGYPCPRHMAALAALGPCAYHRRSWAFMDALRWSGNAGAETAAARVDKGAAEAGNGESGQGRLGIPRCS